MVSTTRRARWRNKGGREEPANSWTSKWRRWPPAPCSETSAAATGSQSPCICDSIKKKIPVGSSFFFLALFPSCFRSAAFRRLDLVTFVKTTSGLAKTLAISLSLSKKTASIYIHLCEKSGIVSRSKKGLTALVFFILSRNWRMVLFYLLLIIDGV